MGEYANYLNQRIKVGTCEDMYYLRADQRHLVTNSETDFRDPDILAVVRFRFPWPDEDGTPPGQYPDHHDRRWPIHGLDDLLHELTDPEDHGIVQLTSREGYMINLPCPESAETFELVTDGGTLKAQRKELKLFRNGFVGSWFISQQGLRHGQWVTICRCVCGHCFRLDTLEQAERVAVSLRSDADRLAHLARIHPEGPYEDHTATRLHLIADRILAGYELVTA